MGLKHTSIKSQEVEFTKSVYVWFEIGGVVEKMWVRIGKGDQKRVGDIWIINQH